MVQKYLNINLGCGDLKNFALKTIWGNSFTFRLVNGLLIWEM